MGMELRQFFGERAGGYVFLGQGKKKECKKNVSFDPFLDF
jgi:hypothetical protein